MHSIFPNPLEILKLNIVDKRIASFDIYLIRTCFIWVISQFAFVIGTHVVFNVSTVFQHRFRGVEIVYLNRLSEKDWKSWDIVIWLYAFSYANGDRHLKIGRFADESGVVLGVNYSDCFRWFYFQFVLVNWPAPVETLNVLAIFLSDRNLKIDLLILALDCRCGDLTPFENAIRSGNAHFQILF